MDSAMKQPGSLFALLLLVLPVSEASAQGYTGGRYPGLTGVSAPESMTAPLTFRPAVPGPSASLYQPVSAAACVDSGCVSGCTEDGTCGGQCSECAVSVLDGLKNRPASFSDDVTYSVGGGIRYRFMDERNRLRPGGPASSTYDLWRLTPHVSVTWDNLITGYVEAIDASAFGYDAPLFPLGIDVNRGDLLRYYGEINLGDVAGGSLRYRYGRQFLKYGSQHLLSPLGWSNTFRNFEGHKLIWKSGDWTVDAFSMASVNNAAGGAGYAPSAFDTVDSDRQVHGIYGTWTGSGSDIVDIYWIWSDVAGQAANRQDGSRHTIGMRVDGKWPIRECSRVVGTWAWDVEGAIQFGKDDFTAVAPGGLAQDVLAGFFSGIFSYTYNDRAWTPKLSGIAYWGSGDTNPNDGTINTVYTLYPLGHAWWGLIDNFSGQNLLDFGVSGSVSPHEKLSLSATFHWFGRATESDAVYNIAGAPFSVANRGRHIGNELDLVATWKHSESLSLQFGYFWFWYGQAINAGPAARPDASQLYMMTTFTF